MSKELQNLDELEKVINFFSALDLSRDRKQYYQKLDKFLQEEFEADKALFFSLAKDRSKLKNKEISRSCRFLWNKSAIGKLYKKNDINNVLDSIDEEKLFVMGSFDYKNQDESLICFLMGENEEQVYFSIARIKKEIPQIIIDSMIKFSKRALKTMDQIDEVTRLETLVYIDDVTELFNQRKLYKDLDLCIENYNKYKEKFSVLFIDIDHFKNVNDGHGHLVGTELLKSVAGKIREALRDTDLSYRYGGDEFVAIISDADEKDAVMVGERILNGIKKHSFIVKDDKKKDIEFKLTVSIGVAAFPSNAVSREEILSFADKIMYEAKKAGRGKVLSAKEIFKS